MLDGNSRRLYRLIAWVSGLTALAVVVYGIASAILAVGGLVEVGASLVEVEFPFQYFAKPVTYFSIASVAFFYSATKLWEERISRWPAGILSFLQLFAFIVAFASAYEVIYNFMLWGSIFSIQVLQAHSTNPNFVACCLPVTWNLVFATKVFSALLAISGYSVYFLRRFNPDKSI